MNYKAAGGIITDGKNIILVKGRFHKKWGFPKGEINGNETAFKASIREIKEETGLTKINYIGKKIKCKRTTFFYFTTKCKKLCPKDKTEIENAMWINPYTFDFNSIDMNYSLRLFVKYHLDNNWRRN